MQRRAILGVVAADDCIRNNGTLRQCCAFLLALAMPCIMLFYLLNSVVNKPVTPLQSYYTGNLSYTNYINL